MTVLPCNLSVRPTLHALQVCSIWTHSEAVIACLLFSQSILLIAMLCVSRSVAACAAKQDDGNPIWPKYAGRRSVPCDTVLKLPWY